MNWFLIKCFNVKHLILELEFAFTLLFEIAFMPILPTAFLLHLNSLRLQQLLG